MTRMLSGNLEKGLKRLQCFGSWRGEGRGQGEVGFVVHPTRTSQTCSIALLTVIIFWPAPPIPCPQHATAYPDCAPFQPFCDGAPLQEAWVRAPAQDTQPVFPSCCPVFLLYFLLCLPEQAGVIGQRSCLQGPESLSLCCVALHWSSCPLSLSFHAGTWMW